MPLACVLCGSKDVTVREVVSVQDLNAKYAQAFGIEHALNSTRLDYCVCASCGLGYFDPMETGGEGLYERLQSFDWYYMAEKYEYAVAQKYLPAEGGVLEVGGGKAAFAKVVGAHRYTGLEFNDKAIEKASEAGIRLIKQTVEVHSSSGNTYDAVVSFQVLEHVVDPAGFIRDCVKCLKRGGRLIIAVPAHDSFVGTALNNILDMPPHHVTHWTGTTLRHLAERFGLEVLAIEYESVAEYHRDWAHKTIWESRLRRWLGMKPKLLDYSLIARLVSKLSSILGKLVPIPLTDVKGHTVIGVYRKI
ncbi:class I SAM-dependent methyltransferase [Thiobacillus denitrificans]|uniref:class I SAM-dependent methyltransferase n=1 Tax=Thiobacillus denitrificans TaxID=36861 RepID=UPI00035CF47A|nr:class I SAM-dependent methyltransferase [Thiobacillus denitrificans]